MSLKILREDFHAQVLHLRKLDYIISSDAFEVAYSKATYEERRKIYRAIMSGDQNALKDFLETQSQKRDDFEKMGIRKLRIIGQRLSVTNYQYLTKMELIKEIKDAVQRAKESIKRVPIQPETARVYEIHIGSEQSSILVSQS